MRGRLLDASVELLEEEGIAAFTARRVAAQGDTSPPAVYELFGNKQGLLDAVAFEGFRRLGDRLEAVGHVDDREGLIRLSAAYREFLAGNPELGRLMLSVSVTEMYPSEEDLETSGRVRRIIVGGIAAWSAREGAEVDATDAAHALVSLVQGLASAEIAGRLGSSRDSVDRRWRLAVESLLTGVATKN